MLRTGYSAVREMNPIKSSFGKSTSPEHLKHERFGNSTRCLKDSISPAFHPEPIPEQFVLCYLKKSFLKWSAMKQSVVSSSHILIQIHRQNHKVDEEHNYEYVVSIEENLFSKTCTCAGIKFLHARGNFSAKIVLKAYTFMVKATFQQN